MDKEEAGIAGLAVIISNVYALVADFYFFRGILFWLIACIIAGKKDA
jgi:hypothetical protein